MKNSKFVFDKLSKIFEQGLVTSKDLASEMLNILKFKRDEIVFKMKLTGKDELEVLSKRVDNIEKKFLALQQKNKKKKSKQVRRS